MFHSIKVICLYFFVCVIHTFSVSQNFDPEGFLDYADIYGGYGWAYDEDAGTLPIDVHVYIDGQLYAVLTADEYRPDLVSNGYTPNAEHGFSFTISGFDISRAHEINIYAIDYGGTSNIILNNCPLRVGNIYSGDATISNMAGPTPITISTTERLAGAIGSLIWNGKEFIDSYDHGRELQSATSFDHLGECFNPTEAGCARDDTGSYSTSFLQYLSVSLNTLETQTLPAFWTQPGDTAPVCGYAINTTERASHYFHKKVSIGMPGMPHVIKYNTSFDIPANSSYNFGTFEVLTAYMPPDFSVFYTYEPYTQLLLPLSDGPGEQELPIIFSTTDSSYALGIYSPDLPDTTYPMEGYGRNRYDDCTKWNCVFKESPVTTGTYSYRSYVIAGSLHNVMVSMTQLYNYFIISADFEADTVCVGMPTTIFDYSVGANEETRYLWDINNDNITDDTTSGDLIYTFNSAGIHTVKLTVINGVATEHQSTVIKDVYVKDVPAAELITGNSETCEGREEIFNVIPQAGNLSYSWSLPVGWTGVSDSSSIIVNVGQNSGQIIVTANNECGSSYPSVFNVTVNPNPPTPVVTYILLILSSDASTGNQWYNQDGAIAGANAQIFTPLQSGYYYVIVTDNNGCVSDTSNKIYVGITDIVEQQSNSCQINFSQSENLNTVVVKIMCIGPYKSCFLRIYNAQGQVIKQEVLYKETSIIDISYFERGLYFFRIEMEGILELIRVIKI